MRPMVVSDEDAGPWEARTIRLTLTVHFFFRI